jgi:hypothetical protein
MKFTQEVIWLSSQNDPKKFLFLSVLYSFLQWFLHLCPPLQPLTKKQRPKEVIVVLSHLG